MDPYYHGHQGAYGALVRYHDDNCSISPLSSVSSRSKRSSKHLPRSSGRTDGSDGSSRTSRSSYNGSQTSSRSSASSRSSVPSDYRYLRTVNHKERSGAASTFRSNESSYSRFSAAPTAYSSRQTKAVLPRYDSSSMVIYLTYLMDLQGYHWALVKQFLRESEELKDFRVHLKTMDGDAFDLFRRNVQQKHQDTLEAILGGYAHVLVERKLGRIAEDWDAWNSVIRGRSRLPRQ